MKSKNLIVFSAAAALLAALFAVTVLWDPAAAEAGQVLSTTHYQALAPITHGNLTIFPVVAATIHDTREFLTLDEGLRSGEVVVTEAGRVSPMIRRRTNVYHPPAGGAEVNRLVLVNNSKRPLLLLAGEIVTGGKQDRIVGKDRIVPGESDADLSVFCVEPGRWTETSAKFNGAGGYGSGLAYMAQPSVRERAMGAKDQAKVWDEVRKSQRAMTETVEVTAGAPAVTALNATSSYARVMENKEVTKQVDAVAAPIQHSYESLMHELRARNAVGVVVAVNGRIIWADLFAGTALLEKYWPKLVRSYAAEAIATVSSGEPVSVKAAQQYLDQLEGRHEVSESEPGVYRHTEITGDGFKAFELTSLLPNTGFDVHVSKMTE